MIFIEYFDSFGLSCPQEVVDFSEKSLGSNYSKFDVCSMWLLLFVLYKRAKQTKVIYEVIKPFSHTDTNKNEKLIMKYFI